MKNARPFRPRFEPLEARDVPAALFVATNGSDGNPGSIAKPFKTLAKAVAAANPGDEVVLRAGTYAGGVTVGDPRVTVRSQDGEWAVIAAPIKQTAVANAIRLQATADDFTLKRVEVSGGYYYALMADGATGLRVEDCKLHDSGRDVVKLTPGADDATILRSSIYNSGKRDASNAEGVDNVNADRMVVRDCHVYNIATTGIYPKGGATDCVVERNLIRNTGVGGVMVGFYTDAEWMDPKANPGYYESIRATVRNNVIVGTKHAGIGLYASLDARVYNNTLVDVAQVGQAGLLFDQVSHYFSGKAVGQTNLRPTVVNNIVSVSPAANRPAVDVRTGGLTAGTLTAGNNLYYQPAGAAVFKDSAGGVNLTLGGWAAWTKEANSRVADPLLDASFHLSAGSPAVGAARAAAGLADDYDGNPRAGAADVGADEYAAGAALRTPPAAGTIGTGGGGAAAAAPPANTPPTVSAVAGRSVPAGGSTGAVAFAVADAETAAGSLVVTATSSDPVLVPAGGLVLGGSGGARTVTVTPAADRTGTATITLTVTDGGGLTAARTFVVTVAAQSAAAVEFVGTDEGTQGAWGGVYGSAGYALAGGPAALPAGATLTADNKYDAAWKAGADPRAVDLPDGTGAVAAAWVSYKTAAYALDLGGDTRRVSVYLLDWERVDRSQRIDVVDGDTGAVLDARTASGFGEGVYLTWQVTGKVTFKVTRLGDANSAVSGFFFD